MTRGTIRLACIVAGLAFLAPAAEPNRKAPPWEKPLVTGLLLFRQNCSVCHEINKPESRKFGPSLFRFFQNPKTPLTGFPATEDFLRNKVRTGGALMPSFRNTLTDDQIREILIFIRSRH